MFRCELCNSSDMVFATVTKSGKKIAVCKECYSVYEVDENGNPVFGHDPSDIPYFEELYNSFENWSDLEDIRPCNK